MSSRSLLPFAIIFWAYSGTSGGLTWYAMTHRRTDPFLATLVPLCVVFLILTTCVAILYTIFAIEQYQRQHHDDTVL